MSIQYTLEILGTFVFSVSGALAARHRDHDVIGIWFMGFITAIGGGSLRDMLLGSYPLVWVSDITIIYAILAGIVAALLFMNFLVRFGRTFIVFDAFGIALFTLVGTEKALSVGVRPEIAAIMGVFTAVMGGVIRDTLTNEVPVIFQKALYVTPCFAGAVIYLFLGYFHVPRDINFVTSSVVIVAIRLLAVRYNWYLPAMGAGGRRSQ
ncbi:MAG: trimeric intracellular cation channel family protein [Bacteroidetes bacterium]|nr:trimeric intracellular cation channel family protein [Bacteroidota bacterium]